jgi:predicted PurR-regulated permease PerM
MARVRNSVSPLLTLAAMVVAIAALHLAKEILLPLALAILISFLLTPLANRLERLGLGRILSVISVVGVTFLMLGVLGWIVTGQLIDLGNDLPSHRERLVAKVRQIKPESRMFQDITKTLEDVESAMKEDRTAGDKTNQRDTKAKDNESRPGGEEAEKSHEPAPPQRSPVDELRSHGVQVGGETSWLGDLERYFRRSTSPKNQDAATSDAGPPYVAPVPVEVVGTPASPLRQMLNWLGPLASPLATAGIAVVLVIFIMLKREDQRNRLLQLFGSAHLHATTEALTDVTERVSRYLRMQFLINAGYGLAVGLGMYVIGVPNAVMWGVLSFSLRFLPYIGPWLSAIMPLFISIATSEGWTQPIMVIVWFTILELIVNNVAEPLLYGRSTGVSGVGVIIAAVFWTWVWGPIGLVLAMPLTVCVVVMARYIPGLRFLTVLLGDEPAMTDQERVFQRLLAGDVLEARKLLLARLKESSLAEVYDQVLIPALTFAERDRHAGLLHEEQEDAVEETARDLVEDLGEAAEVKRREALEADPEEAIAVAAGERATNLRVLCISLRDEADEISAAMLKQLLEAKGITVEMPAAEALTGELVDWVESLKIDVAVISVLPPLPTRSSRLLCRRLRERYAELPILVGFWTEEPPEEVSRRLCAGDGEVIGTLAAMVERIQVLATHPRIAEKVG